MDRWNDPPEPDVRPTAGVLADDDEADGYPTDLDAEAEHAYQTSARFGSDLIAWARGTEAVWGAICDMYLESEAYINNLADHNYGEALA
jgi:hypothetical protein